MTKNRNPYIPDWAYICPVCGEEAIDERVEMTINEYGTPIFFTDPSFECRLHHKWRLEDIEKTREAKMESNLTTSDMAHMASKPVTYKAIMCKLVDKNGREVCNGGMIAMNEKANFEDFSEFEKRCNDSLAANFRDVLAAKSQSLANKTIEQVQDIINALIVLEGYKLDWFYCGWENK